MVSLTQHRHRASASLRAAHRRMTPATPRQRRLAYLAWLTVCIVWGTTYLGIRISLETMPPMLMAVVALADRRVCCSLAMCSRRGEAAAAEPMGRHHAAGFSDARAWQRRRGRCRTMGAERPGGGDRGVEPVLDGGDRSGAAGDGERLRANITPGPADWIQRNRGAGVAGSDARGRPDAAAFLLA